MLRDRLICSINDHRIQRRLLAELGLTFTKVMELAQPAEAEDKNARDLEKVNSTGIHKVSSDHKTKEGGGRRSTAATPCYRCGGKHPSDKCRFRDEECHHCGKKGHIARAC